MNEQQTKLIDLDYFNNNLYDYEYFLRNDLKRTDKTIATTLGVLRKVKISFKDKKHITEQDLYELIKTDIVNTHKNKITIMKKYLDYLCINDELEIFKYNPNKNKSYFLIRRKGAVVEGVFDKKTLMKRFNIECEVQFQDCYNSSQQALFGDYELLAC